MENAWQDQNGISNEQLFEIIEIVNFYVNTSGSKIELIYKYRHFRVVLSRLYERRERWT